MAVRALYIDLNSYFASCEQQENPQLRGKAIAVVPMLSDTTCVIAASYEAKKFGIKTGTKVGDAKKMCPGIVLLSADHSIYIKYHHAILKAVDLVVPIHSVCSIDEIACELTGSQTQVEVATELAYKIKKILAQEVGEHLKCSIGLSTNFLLAKIACDMQKPDGLTVITQKDLPHKLHSLKLQDIPGIGRKMEARLHAQGVFSIEQLLSKNEQQVRTLWHSILGARYYQLLSGAWLAPAKINDAKSIGHSHVLPPIERNYKDALLVAHKLLHKAMVRARREKVMIRKLSFGMKYMDGTGHYEDLKIDETQDTGLLMKYLNKLYLKFPRHKKPIKASITLADFVPEENHQLSMFQNEKRNLAFKVFDQINDRFGKGTIFIGSVFEKKESAPTRIAFTRIPELDEI